MSFEEDECLVIKEKKCIDYREKIIDDYPVTRCWKYEERLRCAGKEKNYCKIFEDNRGCSEITALCLKSANISKICEHFEKKFRCGDKTKQTEEVKHVDTEYLVQRDDKDLSKCSKSFLKDCMVDKEVCVEGAEIRNINGKDVYKDCWKWERKYYCKKNTLIDECKDLRAKCKEKSKECLYKSDDCEHWELTYECEEKEIDKVDCIAGKFCLGGICEEKERFRPNNFGENIGTLATLSQMNKENREGCECLPNEKCTPDTMTNCSFFKGESAKCKMIRGEYITYLASAASIYGSWSALSQGVFSVLGSSGNFALLSEAEKARFIAEQAAKAGGGGPAGRIDCCEIEGVLSGAFCDAKDMTLKMKKGQGLCTKVGRYNELLGLVSNTSYCCFKTKLMRIVQEQGRKQLGISFGTPENPDCRGLTLQEIQSIDFGKIDWSEIIKDFKADAKSAIDKNIIPQEMRAKILDMKNNSKDFLLKRGQSIQDDQKATEDFIKQKLNKFYGTKN